MMANFIKTVSLTLGLFLLWAAEGAAQEVPGRTPPVASTINASELRLIGSGSQLMRVPLNKAVSVRIQGQVRNVIVAQPAIADVILPEDGQRNYVYIVAREVGSTTVIFEDNNGNIIFEGDIQVDVDVAGIKAAFADLLPNEKIEVTSHRNGVFLRGFVRSSSTSSSAVAIARRFVPDNLDVVNSLEILSSQQVVMQVRISEIKRTALKALGVDLGIGSTAGISGGAGLSGATAISSIYGELGQTAFGAVASTVAHIPGLTSITVSALEDQGFAKTLAEPTLTAVSGETASFLAGGSFPMPTSYDAQSGVWSYEQTSFGVGLNFTPIVLDKGRINLKVRTTVSDRDDTLSVTTSSGTIPGLSEKTTETTVELPSGGSLMIAGLIQNDMLNYVEGIPGLMNLPIIGQLFRSEGFKNEETELVITLTAYLAAPTSNARQLALPTDGFAPASDIDFYLLGRLHKIYTGKDLPPYATPVAGPYGYIME